MSDKKPIVMVDLGVLLMPGDDEFESYATVYDRKYGYYDEVQEFRYGSELEDVKAEARKYVEDGVDGTYAVITSQGCAGCEPLGSMDVGSADHSVESVVWSLAKLDGEIAELIKK